MSHPISVLGVDADEEKKLKAARIRTVERLLAAAKDAKGRRTLSAKTGIGEGRLLMLANRADRLRIKGLGKEYSALVEAAGVITTKDLRYRNPANLARVMSETNKRRKLVRFLPTEKAVARWIENAKKLPQMISYK
jgi:hypothetical protein